MTDVTARLEIEIDGSQAAGEASRLERSLDALKGKASGLDGQLNQLKRGTDGAAAGLGKAGTGASNTARQIEAMRKSTSGAIREMGGLARATEDMGTAAARASAGMAGLASSATANTQALARKRAAMQQLGVQFGDFTTQVSLGANVFQAFGAQAGQMAAAATGLGGAAGRVATFFAGPWGAAIIAGTTVLGMLASKLFDTKDAAEDAEKAAADFAKRQMDIGNFIDSTTGKIIEQNKTLRDNAILLRQSKIDANKATIEEGRNEAFDVAERAAKTGTRFVSERQPFAPVFDPEVVKVIGEARGNVEKLDAGFRELVKRRPELKGTADEINKIAAATANADRQNNEAAREIAEISGKATPFAALADRVRAERDELFAIEKKFRDAEADIERRLKQGGKGGLTDKQASAELRKAYAEREAGLKRLEAAEESRRKASAAARTEDREAAKSQREAIKDAREAESAYASLVGSFDNVAAAGLRYADRLEDIRKAAEAGLITEEQAGVYALAAAEEQAEAVLRPLRDLAERYDEVAAATYRYNDALKAIDKAQAQGLAPQTADVYRAKAGEEFTRAKVRAIGDDVADMIADNPDLFGKSTDTALRRMYDGGDAIGYVIGDAFGKRAGQAARSFVAAIRAAQSGDYSRLGRDVGGRTGAVIDTLDTLFGGKDEAGKNTTPLAKAFGKEMQEVWDRTSAEVFKPIKNGITKLVGQEGLGKLTQTLGKLGAGMQQGKIVDGLFDAVGIKSSSTGAQIGGSLGNAIGGPIGGWIGAMAGGILGGLLKKDRKATVTLGTGAFGDGDITGTTASGKGKAKRLDAAESTGNAVLDFLNDMARAFGSGLAANANLGSIGSRNDKFTFDPSGQGFTKRKNGALHFDTEEEAVAAAIRNAVERGVIQGIRESTKRLITAGDDFQAALDKAVKFESVFSELEQRKDPTGFALKQLDKEFAELRNIFAEASASVEEYASLEELYQLKRKDILTQGNEALLTAEQEAARKLLELRDPVRASMEAFGKEMEELRARITAQGGNTAIVDQLAEETRRQMLRDAGLRNPTSADLDFVANAPNATDAVKVLGAESDIRRQLLELRDPAAAAVAALDEEFAELRRLFEASGRSMVDLEALYQEKRRDIIEQGNRAALSSMQDYLRELTQGRSTGLSAQTRLANSRAELAQLDADRAMGKSVDFERYRSVADAFLSASRDFNGSTTTYFADLARITATVQDMIAKAGGAVSTLAANDSGATPTTERLQTMAANDPQVGALASAASLGQPTADATAIIAALRSENAAVIAELKAIRAELGAQTDEAKAAPARIGAAVNGMPRIVRRGGSYYGNH